MAHAQYQEVVREYYLYVQDGGKSIFPKAVVLKETNLEGKIWYLWRGTHYYKLPKQNRWPSDIIADTPEGAEQLMRKYYDNFQMVDVQEQDYHMRFYVRGGTAS